MYEPPSRQEVITWFTKWPFAAVGTVEGAQAREVLERDPLPQRKGPPGTILAADVRPKPVPWLWRRYIPLGKVTVLEGDPDLGKSTLTCDLAARVSTGAVMPDGSSGVQGGVVLLTSEDDLADTVLGRLKAHGANLQHIRLFESDTEGPGLPRLPDEIERIRDAVASVGAKLVVIDPLMALLSREVKTHHDHDVRRALHPLSLMARETGAAVIVVRHLNKQGSRPAMYRGGGSIGIIGAARAGLLVAKDPNDEERRVLVAVKMNLSEKGPGLTFVLEDAGTGPGARISWEGISAHDADSLLNPSAGAAPKTARAQVREILHRELADGVPRPIARLVAICKAHVDGVSERTIRRAAKDLNATPGKDGFGGPGTWQLPSLERRPNTASSPEDGQNGKSGQHGENGQHALRRRGEAA
jgi:hypothetical protein